MICGIPGVDALQDFSRVRGGAPIFDSTLKLKHELPHMAVIDLVVVSEWLHKLRSLQEREIEAYRYCIGQCRSRVIQ